MPKVSVVIPVYNVEKYLRECLDSVVVQTLKDIEIICVNDGSTDNSGKILDEYAAKDKRIKVIHQDNKGLSAARNVGIDLAKGEFIGFVDSDDWIGPDFYLRLYKAATEYDTDIAACNILRIQNDGKQFFIRYHDCKVANSFSRIADLLYIPRHNYVWNKIYKTSMLKDNEIYFPEGIYFEDMRWSPMVIFHAKNAVSVPDETYYYRWNDNSIISLTKPGTRYEKDCTNARDWEREFMRRYYISNSKTYYKLFGFIPLLKIEEK